MQQGLIIVTIQAREPSLRPLPELTPSTSQAVMLYVGLYAVAFGIGGVIANLPTHGADQFDGTKKQQVSRYFNWFFFCLCIGGMLAVTFMVWIQENKGWGWGLGCSTGSLALALIIFASGTKYYRHKLPSGSPLTRIFKVKFFNWSYILFFVLIIHLFLILWGSKYLWIDISKQKFTKSYEVV